MRGSCGNIRWTVVLHVTLLEQENHKFAPFVFLFFFSPICFLVDGYGRYQTLRVVLTELAIRVRVRREAIRMLAKGQLKKRFEGKKYASGTG